MRKSILSQEQLALLKEAREEAKLINTAPAHSPRLSFRGDLTEGESPTLANLSDLLYKLTELEAITPEDEAAYDKLVRQLRYEARYKRFHLIQLIYNLIIDSFHQVKGELVNSGEGIGAGQLRLMMKMFLDQSREEYDDKKHAPLIDARRQTINVIKIVEVDPADNARTITVENFDE